VRLLAVPILRMLLADRRRTRWGRRGWEVVLTGSHLLELMLLVLSSRDGVVLKSSVCLWVRVRVRVRVCVHVVVRTLSVILVRAREVWAEARSVNWYSERER
jgi:hypothetical protein